MADDLLSWIDHPANIRANAVLLRAVADQSLLHADEIDRLRSCLYAQEAIKPLYDEIKRLRNMLDKIAKHPDTPELIRQYAIGMLEPKP